MCRPKSQGGRRCHYHKTQDRLRTITPDEWDAMPQEDKDALREPQRIAFEEKMRRKRAEQEAIKTKQQNKTARVEARERERAELAGRKAAEKLLPPDSNRITLHLSKDTVPAGGGEALREAALSEPYEEDRPLDEVLDASRRFVEAAEEAVRADRSHIQDPNRRGGRLPHNPYDRSREVFPKARFTAEEERDLDVEAGVYGLTRNAYLKRQVENTVKPNRTDMRAAVLSMTPDAREGRELWLHVPENERRELIEQYVTADTALARTRTLGTVINRGEARLEEIQQRLKVLKTWEQNPHPDGWFGPEGQQLSKRDLAYERHLLGAEATYLETELPGIKREHAALVKQHNDLVKQRFEAQQRVMNALMTVAQLMGSGSSNGQRFARAFMTSLRFTAERARKKRDQELIAA